MTSKFVQIYQGQAEEDLLDFIGALNKPAGVECRLVIWFLPAPGASTAGYMRPAVALAHSVLLLFRTHYVG